LLESEAGGLAAKVNFLRPRSGLNENSESALALGMRFCLGRESVERTADKPKIPLDFRSAVRFTDSRWIGGL